MTNDIVSKFRSFRAKAKAEGIVVDQHSYAGPLFLLMMKEGMLAVPAEAGKIAVLVRFAADPLLRPQPDFLDVLLSLRARKRELERGHTPLPWTPPERDDERPSLGEWMSEQGYKRAGMTVSSDQDGFVRFRAFIRNKLVERRFEQRSMIAVGPSMVEHFGSSDLDELRKKCEVEIDQELPEHRLDALILYFREECGPVLRTWSDVQVKDAVINDFQADHFFEIALQRFSDDRAARRARMRDSLKGRDEIVRKLSDLEIDRIAELFDARTAKRELEPALTEEEELELERELVRTGRGSDPPPDPEEDDLEGALNDFEDETNVDLELPEDQDKDSEDDED